jgi:hypothetical protein
MDHDLLSPLRDPQSIAEPDWQVMEARLHQACVAGSGSSATRSAAPVHDWRRWLAAAAAVVMAAAITFYTVPQRNVRPQPEPRLPAAPSTPEPAPQPAPARLDRPKAPATPPPPRAQAGRPPTPAPAAAGVNEFVPLPGAFALPDFESGRIVRMEVPIAGLPAFGIDLVPDAAPAAVEADFLIGQDGLPRAIRLASTRVR